MKVLNIGALNIDRTYTVKRFVQPKETIRASGYEEFCGGKGLNQSVALARAGVETYHAGAVGRDGELLMEMLKESGVHTEYVRHLDGASGHAVIQVDEEGQNNIIIVGGANGQISCGYIQEVLEKFEEGDMVLLQNEVPNIDFAMEEAKRRKMQIAFNPSPVSESIYQCDLNQVDYFILNEVEGAMLAGTTPDDVAGIQKNLGEKYPQASFILTLGEKGAIFFNRDETIAQDSFRVSVVDTTGAGDTFCGYFLAGIAAGRSYRECLKEASAAGALAVGRKGAASGIPRREEVVEFLSSK